MYKIAVYDTKKKEMFYYIVEGELFHGFVQPDLDKVDWGVLSCIPRQCLDDIPLGWGFNEGCYWAVGAGDVKRELLCYMLADYDTRIEKLHKEKTEHLNVLWEVIHS